MRKPPGDKTMSHFNEKTSDWELKLGIASLVLIFAGTLFPYEFSFAPEFRRDTSTHYLAHMLLFIPFGFALACILRKKRRPKATAFLLVPGAIICLAVVSELLQFFLPRSVSLGDALANIVGASSGFFGFHLFGHQLAKYASILAMRTRRWLTISFLGPMFLVYFVGVCVTSTLLQSTTDLMTWDDSFPLLVGNEQSGNRPWEGRVYQLQIADRALGENEIAQIFAEKGRFASIGEPLMGSYQFTDEGRYLDRTKHLPELVWKGPARGKSGFIGADRWLESAKPAVQLSRSLKRTSQFTIATTIASGYSDPHITARIVSLSKDPYHRNFTLAQEGTSLVFRLRTPLTGENGNDPALVVPDVFVSEEPLFVVITYDGSKLRAFINGARHPTSLELVPEAALFNYWFPVTAENMTGYKMVYYAILFIPVGFFATFLLKALKFRSATKVLLAGITILLPSVILQTLLAGVTGKLNSETLFLGAIFSVGAMAFFSQSKQSNLA
jgi:VanZ family protein